MEHRAGVEQCRKSTGELERRSNAAGTRLPAKASYSNRGAITGYVCRRLEGAGLCAGFGDGLPVRARAAARSLGRGRQSHGFSGLSQVPLKFNGQAVLLTQVQPIQCQTVNGPDKMQSYFLRQWKATFKVVPTGIRDAHALGERQPRSVRTPRNKMSQNPQPGCDCRVPQVLRAGIAHYCVMAQYKKFDNQSNLGLE